MAGEEQLDSLASPWRPSWSDSFAFDMLHYCIPLHEQLPRGVHTGHVVESEEEEKNSKQWQWEFNTRKEWKRRCEFFVLLCSLFTKATIFVVFCHQCSCSIQKVRQDSLKVNHGTVAHNRSFSITTQLPYLWELLLMESILLSPSLPPASPYLHFSFVVLILFCGLLLMKCVLVNRSGIRGACNFSNTMTWITMSWWDTDSVRNKYINQTQENKGQNPSSCGPTLPLKTIPTINHLKHWALKKGNVHDNDLREREKKGWKSEAKLPHWKEWKEWSANVPIRVNIFLRGHYW